MTGARRPVSLVLLGGDSVGPGDWALVHAGFALSAIDETEARETLALLQEMSDAFVGESEPAVGVGEVVQADP